MAVPHSGAPATLPVTADAALRNLSATSGRFKGEPTFDVMSYGAVGDGATDDTVAVQAAITAAAASGGIVNGSSRRYKVTSTLNLGSNVRLRDMTLDASSLIVDDNVIEATGTVASAVLLASDAIEGALTATAVSGDTFAANDWVLISSTAVFGSTSQPRGEIARIASISSGTLTLYDPLADSYATADSAQVQKITFVEGVQIDRVHIIGPDDSALSIAGIVLDRVRDAAIRDCTFTKTHYSGVLLRDAVGTRVIGCNFDRIEKAGLAYGVAVLWASQDVAISACTGARMRHLVTIGGGTSRPGIARRVAVTGCVASQAMDAGFDCHPGGEDISFVGNHVYGSDGTGITFQGSRGVISGNTIRDSVSHGILIQPLTIKSHDVVVTGNTVLRSGSRGITVITNASYPNFRGFVISDNSVQVASGVGAPGIEVLGTGALIAGVVISNNVVRGSVSHQISVRLCDYASISGNMVEVTAASTQGIRLLTVNRATVVANTIKSLSLTSTRGILLSGADDCTVAGNTIADCGIGILTDATSDNNAITGNNVRGNTTPLSIAGTGNIQTGNLS